MPSPSHESLKPAENPEEVVTLNVSLTMAQVDDVIQEGPNNGLVEGISAGKGGRAWLEGEFELDYLEALVLKIRHYAGKNAMGVAFMTEIREQHDRDQA